MTRPHDREPITTPRRIKPLYGLRDRRPAAVVLIASTNYYRVVSLLVYDNPHPFLWKREWLQYLRSDLSYAHIKIEGWKH